MHTTSRELAVVVEGGGCILASGHEYAVVWALHDDPNAFRDFTGNYFFRFCFQFCMVSILWRTYVIRNHYPDGRLWCCAYGGGSACPRLSPQDEVLVLRETEGAVRLRLTILEQ